MRDERLWCGTRVQRIRSELHERKRDNDAHNNHGDDSAWQTSVRVRT
jgi:hypothetical protein